MSMNSGTASHLLRFSRMLHGRAGIALTLFVFDVLAVEGLATTMLRTQNGERSSRN
jgi:hypothetical protein